MTERLEVSIIQFALNKRWSRCAADMKLDLNMTRSMGGTQNVFVQTSKLRATTLPFH
jgi:hypothetical protein